MLISIILLVVSLALILFASILFTNGIESLGARLNLHQGAVGSILAAVGTALPETVIPLIAIVFHGGEQAQGIAIGAIVGAPFMLGTLAFFVTALAVYGYAMLGRRGKRLEVDTGVFGRDILFFLAYYIVAVLVTWVHDYLPLRIGAAVLLLLGYGWYVRLTLRAETAMVERTDALYLTRYARLPSTTTWVLVQVVGALVVMVAGAHLFVGAVDHVAEAAGVSALILSLIITPIATELPEKCNSIIWIGQRKDTLALGNITGAMVFQSSIPVVFGILFTPWQLAGATILSAFIALAMGIFLLIWVKACGTLHPAALLAGGALYAVFIVYVLAG